jgi:predicted DNA-binding protein (MmcQ/YjbR family)
MGDAMSRDMVNAICRSFPGAKVSDPWGGGHDAWKVGGKMLACIGAVTPGVFFKTDPIETAQMLIDAGVGVKAAYFHRSWVNLPWGTAEDELRHRLATSYRLVRSSLPKRVRAERSICVTRTTGPHLGLNDRYVKRRRVDASAARRRLAHARSGWGSRASKGSGVLTGR